MDLTPSPRTLFFTSTKFPTRAVSSRRAPVAEMRERPDLRPAREWLAITIVCGLTSTLSSSTASASTLPVRIVQPEPTRVFPRSCTHGSMSRVRADGDFWIDQTPVSGISIVTPASIMAARFAPSKHRIHSRPDRARVASKDFVRIGGEDGLHILAFSAQRRDRVGQVQLFVNVLRFQTIRGTAIIFPRVKQ